MSLKRQEETIRSETDQAWAQIQVYKVCRCRNPASVVRVDFSLDFSYCLLHLDIIFTEVYEWLRKTGKEGKESWTCWLVSWLPEWRLNRLEYLNNFMLNLIMNSLNYFKSSIFIKLSQMKTFYIKQDTLNLFLMPVMLPNTLHWT